MNNINFKKIKEYLIKNSIDINSSISDDEIFKNFNSLQNASSSDLSFCSNNSSLKYLVNSKAKACLISEDFLDHLPSITKPIIVDDTYKAFALVTNLFINISKSNAIISKNSFLNESVNLDQNIQIDDFVSIKDNCKIEKNVIIESNCSIGPNVIIGANTHIFPNTVILNSIIGSNCVIKSCAVIGGTGFGFDNKSKTKIHHFGNVIIKNNCNIGSNTTIDRAVFDSTIISENCFIDNQVQIAHNVILGKGSIIAAQSGIAGSTVIGNNVMIGGQSGVSGHLKIGDNVKIAAKSGVTKNLNNNSVVAGFPAIDIKKWKLKNIKLNKL